MEHTKEQHELEIEYQRRRESLRREEARHIAQTYLIVWAQAQDRSRIRWAAPEGWGTEERCEDLETETSAAYRVVEATLLANGLYSPELRSLLVHVVAHGQPARLWACRVRTARLSSRLSDEYDADGVPTGRQIEVEDAVVTEAPLIVPHEIRLLGWTLDRLLEDSVRHVGRVLTATALRDGWPPLGLRK
jgi:hypothetical protein